MKSFIKLLVYSVMVVAAVACCIAFVGVKTKANHEVFNKAGDVGAVNAALVQPLRPEQQLLDCTYALIESLPDSLKQLELTLASTNDTGKPAQVGMQVLAWNDGYHLLTLVEIGDVHDEPLSVADAFEIYNEFDFKVLRCGF